MNKHEAIWVAIRVLGIYLLVQAVIELPAVLQLPPIGRVLAWGAAGVFLVRGGGALFQFACTERMPASR